MKKKKYLIALPSFLGSKGFNHPTIFVCANNENGARCLAHHLTGKRIGDIKKVNY